MHARFPQAAAVLGIPADVYRSLNEEEAKQCLALADSKTLQLTLHCTFMPGSGGGFVEAGGDQVSLAVEAITEG
jgi:hypothetical protein